MIGNKGITLMEYRIANDKQKYLVVFTREGHVMAG